jgi:hypothetical protein
MVMPLLAHLLFHPPQTLANVVVRDRLRVDQGHDEVGRDRRTGRCTQRADLVGQTQ